MHQHFSCSLVCAIEPVIATSHPFPIRSAGYSICWRRHELTIALRDIIWERGSPKTARGREEDRVLRTNLLRETGIAAPTTPGVAAPGL